MTRGTPTRFGARSSPTPVISQSLKCRRVVRRSWCLSGTLQWRYRGLYTVLPGVAYLLERFPVGIYAALNGLSRRLMSLAKRVPGDGR